jgi:RNA polymerase sigma factor (sigma-70 family)
VRVCSSYVQQKLVVINSAATQPRDWPSEQVVSAAQRGDPAAISVLLLGSHAHVRRFARTLCATPEDAEDAAQEALIVLYRKIGTLRATAALAAWMFQVVRRECIRRSRLALSRHLVHAPPDGAELSAEDAALARLEIERVVESIAELPADQRAVLVLRDIQGLSGGATAQTLGLSRAAMKSRLHRGRETLRLRLRASEGVVVEEATAEVPLRDQMRVSRGQGRTQRDQWHEPRGEGCGEQGAELDLIDGGDRS